MSKPKVAVFGASGRIGQAQVRQLLKQGFPVVAVTRNKSVLDRPEFDGAEIVSADLGDRDSIRQVLENVYAAFFQLPSFGSPLDTINYAKNMAEAASAVKLTRLVHNSTMWSPDNPPCGEPTYDHVRAVEDVFLNSDVPTVVVRPVLFMDNLVTNLVKPSIVEDGIYRYVQRPGLEADLISMDDTARYMIEALQRADLTGKRILLGGPERLPVEQVVATLSEVMGKPLKFEYLPAPQYGEYVFNKVYPGFGPDPAPIVAFFDSFYTFNNFSPEKPFEMDVDELNKLIPLKTETFREWASKQDWTSLPEKGTVGSVAGQNERRAVESRMREFDR